MLIYGKRTENWQAVQAKDEQGRFIRQTSSFRNWITVDGQSGPTGMGGFIAEKGRYHLYVALICPWASRTLMVRQLKGLQKGLDGIAETVSLDHVKAGYYSIKALNPRRIVPVEPATI